ncbi:MAG: sigma-54 dependent transcriptional regulator [Bacteroidales bacterium]|nr:sigma-54 dependent transcriptional regulator [Bacteroidales bacterium]
MEKIKILIIDDEKPITDKISHFLGKKGYKPVAVNEPKEGLKKLLSEHFDLCISDIMMPGMNGLDVLKEIKKMCPETEVIMVSAFGDMNTVIQAMRFGAADYVRKPFSLVELQLAIERTTKYMKLQSDLTASEDERSLITRQLEQMIEKDFIGESPAMKRVLDMALRTANDRDASVLITGENGTGKEVVARLIHYASERNKKQFYPVNAAAIPENLLESEFFGHRKGAFTDAREDKKGCFVLANGGTLFLDEISEMPFPLQPKLLRALEERKIKPVGAEMEIPVDVRIISATNKHLNDLIEQEKFRIDLYHRLNTVVINIPPLRERKEDLKPLLDHFIRYFSKKKNLPFPQTDPHIYKELEGYAFPGNVRELRNMVERAMILSKESRLNVSDFFVFQNGHAGETAPPPDYNLEKTEKRLITLALKECGYNQLKAAELLGVSRDALKRKRQKYGIEVRKSL